MAALASSLHLVWRSLGMLRAVRGVLALLLVIGVIASALPYVTVAAFGPMVQVISEAGNAGNLSGVWALSGPLVARQDGLLHHLAGPVPFAVLLAVWAASLVLTQLMYFVNAWIGARVERVLLVDIRQRVHDHLQSLSLDFFLGSRSGELMHRVITESAGVQRLLTDCLLPPLIDMVVLVVVISYLLALSWQMTVAALILTPLALLTLRFAGRHVQAVMRRVMNAERAMATEVEQTISGIAEIRCSTRSRSGVTGFMRPPRKRRGDRRPPWCGCRPPSTARRSSSRSALWSSFWWASASVGISD